MAYSEKAMAHLHNISKIIFLEANYDVIKKRILNFEKRGIAKGRDQTFRELFEERQKIYKKYAEITIDCNHLDQEKLAIVIENTI